MPEDVDTEIASSKPLLEAVGKEEHDVEEAVSKPCSCNTKHTELSWRILAPGIVPTVIIAIYTIILLVLIFTPWLGGYPLLHRLQPSNPAQRSVEFRETYFEKYAYRTSPFALPPGPEVDAAWHDLLKGMNIRVDPSWLSRYNATSIRLADGSGSVAQLGMYHELHCLKKIKHWIYRDHYYPGLAGHDFVEEQTHTEHCLEWLRVAAMCRGDLTLTTLQWSGDEVRKLETEYPVPRICVDTGKLMRWSEGQAVDLNTVELERPP